MQYSVYALKLVYFSSWWQAPGGLRRYQFWHQIIKLHGSEMWRFKAPPSTNSALMRMLQRILCVLSRRRGSAAAISLGGVASMASRWRIHVLIRESTSRTPLSTEFVRDDFWTHIGVALARRISAVYAILRLLVQWDSSDASCTYQRLVFCWPAAGVGCAWSK